MKTKLIAISLIAIGVCITACRQSDDNLLEDDIQSSAQSNQTESQRPVNDSLATDPPRDGSHWKTTDSVKVNPPKNFILKSDSIKLSVGIDDNGPKDPPRDGSHWKTK
ncbi:hypothetical protein OF897_13860 [Chryseobacterium formosus]|uniref:Lipoprotein n=1 Tax=Chryseobacterium formosus TaxID=1537363 RepID=A0ABT3XTZ0_9FLAO|nr:hypothetical protein [Chryseobacterium formosus]MCX8525000.1 hypothetical protein [Chryseobacterium formosus]